MQSVQTFGRKVSENAAMRTGCLLLYCAACGQRSWSDDVWMPLQKTAVAVAHCKRGKGLIKLNGGSPQRCAHFQIEAASAGHHSSHIPVGGRSRSYSSAAGQGICCAALMLGRGAAPAPQEIGWDGCEGPQ